MEEKILYEDKARLSLADGVHEVATVVGKTLGPKGRYVIVRRAFEDPMVVNAGFVVARSFVQDEKASAGSQLLLDAVVKVNDAAGDGTGMATVLADAIISKGMTGVAAGYDPAVLCRGISKAVEEVSNIIERNTVPIKNIEQVSNFANAVSGDKKIGEMITEAMAYVGLNGAVSVEKSTALETSLEFSEGMQYDRGFISAFMQTDMKKGEAYLENPLVLLTDHEISNVHDILHLLDGVVATGRPLFIIADDVSGDALTTLMSNKSRGVLDTVAIKVPGLGSRRLSILEDIAVATGSVVVRKDFGMSLAEADMSMLGTAKSVKATANKTNIIPREGSEQALEERKNIVEHDFELADNDYDREKIQERLSRLRGGVATIYVGATTEADLEEEFERVDRAVQSVHVAIESGIVAGGGVAYVNAAQELDAIEVVGDEKVGVDIVREALEAPLRAIVENAGYEGSVEVAKVKDSPRGWGRNLLTGETGDMLDMGIYDSSRAVRAALQAASSLACLVLVTSAAVR